MSKHTPGTKPHPTETAEYWLTMARSNRAFAKIASNIDSKSIYLREAEQYERQAERIAKATGSAA